MDVKIWPGLFSADATSVNEQRFGVRIKVDIMVGNKSIDTIWFVAPNGYQSCSLESTSRKDGKQRLMIYTEGNDEIIENEDEDEIIEDKDEDEDELVSRWGDLWKSKR